ncbi:MAG: aspartate aminotransferase family protein [Chloroflexota bacterium]
MSDVTLPDELARLDAAHVLHPHAKVGHPARPLVIARGKGALVWDAEGKEYIDGTGGLWLNAVGHGREELARAAAEQMRQLEYYSSFGDLANEPSLRLAARLAGLAPPRMNTVYFTNGGSEGNETAIKLVRLAQHHAGKPDRTTILSRHDAYHGSSGTSMAASGLDRLKQGFGPAAPGFIHLSAPRARTRVETDALVEEVERTIEETGAEHIAAFIGEPVQGVGGVITPPEGYWEGVQAVLRRHGLLFIVDEVITAYGRTGSWFASQRYNLDADVIVTAKALTSGYVPMGAVLISDRLRSMLDGAEFRHGFTFNGHPVGAAVALENLRLMEQEHLVQRAEDMGDWLLAQLRKLEADPHVAEVRGVGMMLAIELTCDPAPAVQAAREAGVLVRGYPPNIIICPPLVLEQAQAERLVQVLTEQILALR